MYLICGLQTKFLFLFFFLQAELIHIHTGKNVPKSE